MASSFNLKHQNKNIDSKIVVSLERISEAFRVLLWEESKEHSLSPIQVQILIFLLCHSRDKGTISYLANEFNMTKATISDSVKVLLNKGLVEKSFEGSDSRSFIILLTPSGQAIAKKTSLFAGKLEKPLANLTQAQKEIMLNGLLNLIYELNQGGIITLQRMCFTCDHYRHQKGGHYCNLIQAQLRNEELRVDCPEHELKQ
ncbi:MAG TPA: MarR family winged helix-turn-helix transcriptional regulator [Cytophagaceae bacterium]